MKRVMLTPFVWVDADNVRSVALNDYGRSLQGEQLGFTAHIGGEGKVGCVFSSWDSLLAKVRELGWNEAADEWEKQRGR